ncbi:MAG: hypothetical protein KDK65_03060, partial [Chlamydiia bacterium]|nr:hypothetical protein [Chlamydiia bacterium]
FKDILKVSSKPLTIEGVRLVVLKGSEAEELVPVFNNGLEKVKQSGAYLELLKRWGFTNGNIPDQTKS